MTQFAAINIEVTDADKAKVAEAIVKLNELVHMTNMTRSAIACMSELKETKVRLTLEVLMNAGEILRYATTDNPSRQRYYYLLSDLGKKKLEERKVGIAQ